MKFLALMLACCVLLLSLLPAVGTSNDTASAKKGCMQCCKKGAPLTPAKKAADKELTNPFYGCSTCAAVLISEFSFQVDQQPAGFVRHSAKVHKLYYSPLFEFWHPPRMIVPA